jgi:hypothetical protein
MLNEPGGAAVGGGTKKGRTGQSLFFLFGPGDWIRTSGPLLPKQVRYQTAPRPDMPEYYTTRKSRYQYFS